MARPRGTTGSLSPTFVPARHVRLAVRLPSAFALSRTISNRAEGTFERLRYLLGGDRPSQTAHQAHSCVPSRNISENQRRTRVVSHRCLHPGWRPDFTDSHLSCTCTPPARYQAAVKIHGVFPSSRGSSASSQTLQFHRVAR